MTGRGSVPKYARVEAGPGTEAAMASRMRSFRLLGSPGHALARVARFLSLWLLGFLALPLASHAGDRDPGARNPRVSIPRRARTALLPSARFRRALQPAHARTQLGEPPLVAGPDRIALRTAANRTNC
jgi:hypothetical protein